MKIFSSSTTKIHKLGGRSSKYRLNVKEGHTQVTRLHVHVCVCVCVSKSGNVCM
jgi:hypothetical protein